MKKRVLAAILTGIMLLGLAGCGGSGQTDAQTSSESGKEENAEEVLTESAAEGESVKIGVLMKTMSDTFSNKLGEAIKAYQEEAYPDAELYLMDGQADVAKQISQAEDLIAKQVDVIILNPQDADGSAQVLDLASDAGIPVIEVNTETTRTDYVSYVGSNDVMAGEIMGNFVMEQMGEEGGQYAILEGEIGQSAQILRAEGIANTIQADDTYECVAQLTANWQRDEAMATTEDWLGKYPDLKAIICHNDDMSMGALQAAEAQERDIIIIGTDAIPDALAAVKEGRLNGTVLQDAATQASTAVDVAVKVASGEAVEAKYDVPFQRITIENVDEFIEE